MSSQFDVYRNLLARDASDPPYLVNLQSDLIDALGTVIVAPLWETDPPGPTSRIAVTVRIGARLYYVGLAELTSVSRKSAGPVVTNIKDVRDRIVRGLDLLFTGI